MSAHPTSETVRACHYLISKYAGRPGLKPEQIIRRSGFKSPEDVRQAIQRHNILEWNKRRRAGK